MAAANEFDASDLHLVAGVPPAFRVNGEIIIADEDALTEEEIAAMADSLLNEQQKKKFEQEWELCISLLHSVAGRVRATFYRRNGHPEMSFRFCGERIATREELGLPEKIDDLARKPERAGADHRPDRRGQNDDAQLSGGPRSTASAAAKSSPLKTPSSSSTRTSAPSSCSRKC